MNAINLETIQMKLPAHPIRILSSSSIHLKKKIGPVSARKRDLFLCRQTKEKPLFETGLYVCLIFLFPEKCFHRIKHIRLLL
jgi:hypothetical protein